MTAVEDILGSAELWAGAAGGMVAAGLVIATGARLRPALGLAAAVGLAALPVAASPWFWFASLVAVAVLVRGGSECDTAVMASWGAVAGAYVCAPDTELALVVAGAVGVIGVAALALGWPWRGSGAVVSLALVWIAVTDASPRASAVIGTLAVAAVHALLQVGLPSACPAGIAPAGRSGGHGRVRPGRRAGRWHPPSGGDRRRGGGAPRLAGARPTARSHDVTKDPGGPRGGWAMVGP